VNDRNISSKERASDEYLQSTLTEISRARALDSQMISTTFFRMLLTELIERRACETTVRRPGRIHINGLQLKHALDFVDQDDESELVIEHVDFERPDGNSPDETMPAGLYAWFYDYPDEGSLLLPESAVKTSVPPEDPHDGLIVELNP
jgi:hypothetical protein